MEGFLISLLLGFMALFCWILGARLDESRPDCMSGSFFSSIGWLLAFMASISVITFVVTITIKWTL